MVDASDPLIYRDSLVLLAISGIVVPLLHHFRVNPVIAILGLGALLGPHGLGGISEAYPALRYFTIQDIRELSFLGEMGVIFLLFLIGIKLSIKKFMTMPRLIFGVGGVQVVVSTLLIAVGLKLLGMADGAAILLGASLSLSSTAIVVQILEHQRRMNTSTGRVSFSVLLFQDLAVIPILLLVGIIGGNGQHSAMVSLGLAVVQAVGAIVVIYLVSRFVIRPSFRVVALTGNPGFFAAITLLAVVGSGVIASMAGASMALGAFVAGVLMADTEYSRAIGAMMSPFKGLLLNIFFFCVGAGLNLGPVALDPLPMVGAVLGLVALKTFVLFPVVRLFGFSWQTALKSALLLAPAGEFAFVVVGLCVSSGIIAVAHGEFVATAASLSMTLIPLMAVVGLRFTQTASALSGPIDAPSQDVAGQAQVVVVGLGRVGLMACEMLEKHGIPFVGMDKDAAVVTAQRAHGIPAYYGDAMNPMFLRQCGISTARLVIITSNDQWRIDEVVRTVRQVREDIMIVSRAHDAPHAKLLYALGVTDAVPETIEASLQLSEVVLERLGFPVDDVLESIHEKRTEIRADLERAALDSGRGAASDA